MRNILSALIICILIFTAGVYTGYKFLEPKQIIKEVEVIKNVDKIIYRDYMSVDCCEIAKGYDTSYMQIKYTVNALKPDYTDIDLTWRLYEREGLQNVHIPVYQAGNWKFYAGIGIGAVAVGGAVYILTK